MALVEIGMTQEEALAAISPAPAGKYRLTFEGFLLDTDNGGGPTFSTKAGGMMVKARFRISSPDPAANGKSIIYNGVIGSFSFANLCKVLPIMQGTGLDTEGAVGTDIEADVTVRAYQPPDGGDPILSNDIKKMYAI